MSSPESIDVAVIGLGAMGSATLDQLARRGVSAVGFDRHEPPHLLGSSGGESRITRLASHEGEYLTRFAQRSQQLWRELEQETGADLLTRCGGLQMAPRESVRVHHAQPAESFVDRAIRIANHHGVAHEVVDADAIAARWPQFRLVGHEIGYYEPDAGFVRPERCIENQLATARRRGATVHSGMTVQRLTGSDTGVRIDTSAGTWLAGRAVVCAGPWTADLVAPAIGRLLRVEKQTLHWFEALGDVAALQPDRMPVYIWDQSQTMGLYGFPLTGAAEAGVKVGFEVRGPAVHPETVDRSDDPDEARRIHRDLLEGRLPQLGSRVIRRTVCMYTSTPDGAFIIDHDPSMAAVTVVSACSGHGFKHSAAIGEAVAETVISGRSTLDLSPFALARFDTATTGA